MFVTKEESVYMQYLHQEKGLSFNQILRRFPQYSKATICRHMKRPIDHNVFDRHANNPGRPKKLTERDERNIIRAVHHLRSDLELRLVFSPQLLCGLYAEYLIDMDIGIYNHAGKAC